MTDSEKWAVWSLGVVALTTAAYFTFVALRGEGPKAISVFALLALVAVPKAGHRSWRSLDERERGIAHKALETSWRAGWLMAIALSLVIWRAKGWDMAFTVPMWRLQLTLWWLGVLMLAVRSVATLVLYRRGSNG